MVLGGRPLPHEARIDCIACGSALYFLPDSYPLAFHCDHAHFFTLQDLLDELLSTQKVPTETIVETWEKKAALLHEMAREALQDGHAFTAADFQETAERLDGWVAKLRVLAPRIGFHPPVSG